MRLLRYRRRNRAPWRFVALAGFAAVTCYLVPDIRNIVFFTKYDPELLAKRNDESKSLAEKKAKREEIHTTLKLPDVVKTVEKAEDDREDMYLRYIASHNKGNKTKKKKRLPDVIGIGAEKCGTGPLQWMMVHHPLIVGSFTNELTFFGSERVKRGKEYYRNLMPPVASYELASEKTPAYFNALDLNVPKDMKRIVPDAKLLLILCDPVNRTYSDFVQEKIIGVLPKDANFEQLMEEFLRDYSKMPMNNDSATIDFIFPYAMKGKRHILSIGLYYYHLLRWFKVYDRSQILIVDGEELLTDPGSVMEKVQEFLKIPKLVIKEDFVRDSSGFFCINTLRPTGTGANIRLEKTKQTECMKSSSKGRTRMGKWQYKPSMEIMESLRKFFAPHNKKLFDLLGRKFNWQQLSS